MKPVTPELNTECAVLDLWEFSELKGSLHHAEQGKIFFFLRRKKRILFEPN